MCLAFGRLTGAQRFTSNGWTEIVLTVMVLYLWRPAGQEECRALCLDMVLGTMRVHPKLPGCICGRRCIYVVKPRFPYKPGYGEDRKEDILVTQVNMKKGLDL